MRTPGWEHFAHEADLGVRGYGKTLEQAFEQAATALTAAITDPQAVAAAQAVELHCEAPDQELLLVDWLNALITEMGIRKMLFGRFEVKISGSRLQATAWGERVVASRHRPVVEVKGATYTELSVRRCDGDGWVVECVVDV